MHLSHEFIIQIGYLINYRGQLLGKTKSPMEIFGKFEGEILLGW